MKKNRFSIYKNQDLKFRKGISRSFEARMMDKVTLTQENELSERHPFKVPENYFKQL